MLEVMSYLLDNETSTYCKSQKKLTAMVSLWKIRMPDNHESIYFVNTSYIIADTTGERWFKFPTYCRLGWVFRWCWVLWSFQCPWWCGHQRVWTLSFCVKFLSGSSFQAHKTWTNLLWKNDKFVEILWSWSSKPADDIFEILRLKLIDQSKDKSMNHNPKWLKIQMQPNIQTFTFVFFVSKLPGFFKFVAFLNQKKPKLSRVTFLFSSLGSFDRWMKVLNWNIRWRCRCFRGKILPYCLCAWIIPGSVSSWIDGEYLPPFQGVWNAGWNMIWNMQWSLLPLESFIRRCCKLIVCRLSSLVHFPNFWTKARKLHHQVK